MFPFGYFVIEKLILPPRVAYHTFAKTRFFDSKGEAEEFLLIYGGVNDFTYFRKLFLLQLSNLQWYQAEATGDLPNSRRSHCLGLVDSSLDSRFRPRIPYDKILPLLLLRARPEMQAEADRENGKADEEALLLLRSEIEEAEKRSDFLVLFGGSEQVNGYFNCVHVLCLQTMSWRKVPVTGDIPLALDGSFLFCLPRNRLALFGGNFREIRLNVLYVLDCSSMNWTRYASGMSDFTLSQALPGPEGDAPASSPEQRPILFQNGDVPCPRSSCLIVRLTETTFLLFGGWKSSPDEFYNDVFIFDSKTITWKKMECTGDIPEGRSGHFGCIIFNSKLLVFGGFSRYFRDESVCQKMQEEVRKARLSQPRPKLKPKPKPKQKP